MKLFNSDRWSRIRGRGLLRFVLLNGIAGFGVSSAAFAFLFVYLWFRLAGVALPASRLWPSLATFFGLEIILGGTAWALGTWYLSEWLRRRSLK